MSGSAPFGQNSRRSPLGDLLQVSLLSGELPDRIFAVENMLRGRSGRALRNELGGWIVRLLPVEELVPEVYLQWRPLVHDAMRFMVSRLSSARLAPKLVEQMNLAPSTALEARLLRLIAKVPGLQKLGQVLARNRHLDPALRKALSELENGICDVTASDIGAIVQDELASRLQSCQVEIESEIFSEATVSAVMRFTWWNPETQRREAGVFKALKPHVPAYFAEDMELLEQLAVFLGSKHRKYGFAAHGLSETFREVRQLLEHEVDFLREQTTLLKASHLYRGISGIRVPRLIQPLCTSRITAITEERGEKITEAVKHMPSWRRHRIAAQLIEKLIAVPLLAPEADAIFHADPHAGNLLYDAASEELVALDWALTERLSRHQQRHLAVLFLMVALRDPEGIRNQIQALSRAGAKPGKRESGIIHDGVNEFVNQLPLARLPGAVDAMSLVDRLALGGVRFPAPLIMLRKVLFTLDGILHEIAGPDVEMDFVIARYVVQNWMKDFTAFPSPLSVADWIAVQSSALFYGGRLWLQWAQHSPTTS